ncbi:MAG: LacI family DNA-binding transcriptional regulator [Eubacterium sp.]|nr:LacI family DNA-binding transcriptional regulator [Eubacterium sp.]
MTIKDIARESGYSVGTVSRTLNNAEGVSDRARKRIMEVVEKYHFELNSNAKHLKKQSKDGIALIIKGTNNMLFASIVEHLQGMIRDRKYACMVYYIGENDNEVEQAIRICQDRNPYGILFLGSNTEHFKEKFSVIKLPCVMVTSSARMLDFENLSSVSTDDVEAARFAVNHLFALGHRQIGVLGGNMRLSQAVSARYRGTQLAFEDQGLTFEPDRQYESALFSISEGYNAARKLLRKMPDLTAIFAMSDVMAIGAIRALKDAGRRVPEDISVIGFDGLEIGAYTVPKLTTIHQNVLGIATRCVEILLDNLDHGISVVHELEPFYLVPGESVRRRKEEKNNGRNNI